jgi:hypothetical protein
MQLAAELIKPGNRNMFLKIKNTNKKFFILIFLFKMHLLKMLKKALVSSG